jgi:uncharacterized protein with HEPN domain
LREYKLYLNDIQEAVNKILVYTKGYTYKKFSSDDRTIDAVIRNLEVIGEASKHIPKKLRDQYPEVDWQAMVGLRNIIAHEYFGVDLKIIWKTIKERLPELSKHLEKIIAEL